MDENDEVAAIRSRISSSSSRVTLGPGLVSESVADMTRSTQHAKSTPSPVLQVCKSTGAAQPFSPVISNVSLSRANTCAMVPVFPVHRQKSSYSLSFCFPRARNSQDLLLLHWSKSKYLVISRVSLWSGANAFTRLVRARRYIASVSASLPRSL
jgi:hypothetical protein